MDRSAHELFADAPSVSITRLRDDERITGGSHKDQGWTGIVIDLPLVRNVPVQFDEVAPAPLEAAPHNGLGNVVIALSDALGDPLDGAVPEYSCNPLRRPDYLAHRDPDSCRSAPNKPEERIPDPLQAR